MIRHGPYLIERPPRGRDEAGHKTEAVYRRYAIVDSGMLQEAAAKLDQLENSPRKAQDLAFVAER